MEQAQGQAPAGIPLHWPGRLSAIVDDEMFQTVQAMIQEKTAGYDPRPDRPALRLKDCMRAAPMWRNTAPAGWKAAGRICCISKCVRCAAMVTIADAGPLDEVARQWAKHKASRQEPYQPPVRSFA